MLPLVVWKLSTDQSGGVNLVGTFIAGTKACLGYESGKLSD